jgi:cellulose 1,4-beta-cellobiosidase
MIGMPIAWRFKICWIFVDSIMVPEGGNASFEVRISAQPSSDISVFLTKKVDEDEDPDIFIQSNSTLIFTALNWHQNQAVTLAAYEDPDSIPGSRTIRISAEGMTARDITATEVENDMP